MAYKYETSNELYNLFLSKQTGGDFNSSVLKIDSTNWRLPEYSNEPFAQYYHLHPSFLNYPVVNISYEAAIEFCKWLTEYYNNYPKRKYIKIEIRLPTSKEWDMLFSKIESKTKKKQTNDYVSSIDKYKNAYKFFNVLENVKEMTIIKGHAKGGDWKNGIDISNLDYQYKEESSPFIGFRFFVDIVEK
ncbi:MAG: SUMF1/EgtB/PvdO family nonheme iron enzyme [Bacteroidales bacterium]|nr:SUMF1/EgtB/PvdO family nonheme iron enzyme [Bacteroidales bacterium]